VIHMPAQGQRGQEEISLLPGEGVQGLPDPLDPGRLVRMDGAEEILSTLTEG